MVEIFFYVLMPLACISCIFLVFYFLDLLKGNKSKERDEDKFRSCAPAEADKNNDQPGEEIMKTIDDKEEFISIMRAARDYLQKEYNALIRGEIHDFDNSASIIEVTQAIADVTSLMRRVKRNFLPDEARCSFFKYDSKNENGFLLEKDTSKEYGFQPYTTQGDGSNED